MKNLPKEMLEMIDIALKKIADKAFSEGKKHKEQEIKDYYKAAERRLYAYPDLLLNLEKYELDICDIKKECKLSGSSRSKSIVFRPVTGGRVVSKAEILGAKISIIETKKRQDQAEINEVKYALSTIEEDPYYMIIEHKYFDSMTDQQIAEKINCDESTVRRNKSKLLRKLIIKLYGAAAVN